LSLHLFLKKTYLGRAMRAVADDIEAAGLMGINPKKIYAMSYAICALLGCLFGLSFVTTHYVNPMISGLLNLKAFVVTVLSGGNLVLALIAGITLGLCETTITSFVLPTAYQNIVPFTILLIALTILKRKRRL
jgi:branched-chain amino acid transport system permease protein